MDMNIEEYDIGKAHQELEKEKITSEKSAKEAIAAMEKLETKKAQEGIKESIKRAEETEQLEEAITEGFKSEGLRLKELYEKRRAEWTNSFNIDKANSEKVSLDRDVTELLNVFIQLDEKMEAISNNENLSAKGKASELRAIQDIKSEKLSALNNCMTRADALMDGLDLAEARAEAISESEFSLLPGDKGDRANFAIYSELKTARLNNEFQFSACSQRDGKTLIDYRWLLMQYEGACSANDRLTQRFIENIMGTAADNPLDYYSKNEKAGIARGSLERRISEVRAGRVPKELHEMKEKLRFLKRKSSRMRSLSRSEPKDKKFKYMKKYYI